MELTRSRHNLTFLSSYKNIDDLFVLSRPQIHGINIKRDKMMRQTKEQTIV
jgi:hypothetical protein